MCLGVPGRVSQIDGYEAEVEFWNIKRKVRTELCPDVKIGDWVIVHAGFIIQILDEEEARGTLKIVEEIYES